MNKKEIRGSALKIRQSLSEEEWFNYSKTITDYLFESEEYKEARTIHCYLSMNDRNEVNTHPAILRMIKDDKDVYVPITDFENVELKTAKINQNTILETNKWSVPEPKEPEFTDRKDYDLIIVPMVAADTSGNRMGYGKGFYDRFLSDNSGKKIGLVFEDLLYESIPKEQHDQRMDLLITENGIIYTKH